MKTVISDAMQKAHPNLEGVLWRTACMAKEQDNDIMISGLLVRIVKSKDLYWTGSADPHEESILYKKKLIHPAGRIDLRLTTGMIQRSIVVLFAHELKHIGQFHRGRKKNGVLSVEGADYLIEEDCILFEKQIAEAVMGGTQINRGTS
jgi:hypothetical protein